MAAPKTYDKFLAEFSGITALLLRFSIHVMDSCNADPGIEHLEGIREFRKGGPCQPCLFINQMSKLRSRATPTRHAQLLETSSSTNHVWPLLDCGSL